MHAYLDFQATTPLDPEVLEAMMPWLTRPANPHATEHAWGREAEAAVEQARGEVAAALGSAPDGIIFTGSATEAANIIIRSFSTAGGLLVISSIEHPCVEETAEACRDWGAEVVRIPVDAEGLVDLDALGEEIDGASLVSVMTVNNEVGTVQPVDAISTLCRAAGVPFHTDAAQALGRVPFSMTSGISFATLSAHKIYGPQGIGAICADTEWIDKLSPLMSGGGQQRGLRPGTVPVALAVGFGRACQLAVERLDADRAHCTRLSKLFLEQLSADVQGFSVNGSLDQRAPHNLNISFRGISADELLAMLPDLALSTGSACSSGAIAPSRVLTELGLDETSIRGSIRVGFGRTTTDDEVVYAAVGIGAAVRRLRGGVK